MSNVAIEILKYQIHLFDKLSSFLLLKLFKNWEELKLFVSEINAKLLFIRNVGQFFWIIKIFTFHVLINSRENLICSDNFEFKFNYGSFFDTVKPCYHYTN